MTFLNKSTFTLSMRLFVAIALLSSSVSLRGQETTGYFDYDPVTGSLSFDNLLPDNPISSMNLYSTLGVYTGERPEPQSVFDTYSKHKFFTLTPKGLPSPDFGPLMAPGLDPETLANDLCLSGSRLPSGPFGPVELRVGDQSWPISTPGVFNCPAVPHVPRRTIEQIDHFLDFDPATGNLAIDSTDQPLGSIVLRLDRNPGPLEFIGEAPDLVAQELDFQESVAFKPNVLSYIKITGFETADLGPIIEPGTSPEDLANQLCYRSRNAEADKAGALYVRSGDEIHEVGCTLLKNQGRRLIDAQAVNVLLGDSVDVGVLIDEDDGGLIVHVPEIPDGASAPLTRLEINSSEPLFIPGANDDGTLDGFFDSLTSNRLIKSDSAGFNTIDFGSILLPGVTSESFESLAEVSGSFANGSGVSSFQVIDLRVVPEPSSTMLLILSLPVLAFARRRLR